MKTPFVALLFAGLALPIFAQGWRNPFVLDDMSKIQWNADLRTPHPNLSAFFASQPTVDAGAFRTDPSRPLTYLLYWACFQVGKGQPWPFHVLSTILHILCAVLIAGLTLKIAEKFKFEISPAAGVAAGLLFLLAPILAGTVFYAYGLSDILAAFFVLLALERAESSWASSLCFVLGLASKQSAIVYPALLLLLESMAGKINRRTLIVPLAIAAVYVAFRALVLGGIGDLEAHGDVFATGPYALAQGLTIWKYLGLFLVPVGLTIDHYVMPAMYPAALQIGAWIAILLVSYFAWRSRRWRLAGFCWLAFVLCLLPTSSVLPTVDIFVERRAYLADVALAILFGACAGLMIQKWKWPALAALAVLLLANAFLTLQRAQVYQSAEALWREALEIAPTSPRARLNLATTLSGRGEFAEARPLLEELMRQQPRNGIVYSKLAFIFQQKTYAQHNDDQAWTLYQKSFTLEPDDIVALLNAGALLMDHSHYPEAEQLFAHALHVNPNMPYSQVAMGEAQLAQQKYADAGSHFRQALQIDPDFTAAKEHLMKLGQTP